MLSGSVPQQEIKKMQVSPGGVPLGGIHGRIILGDPLGEYLGVIPWEYPWGILRGWQSSGFRGSRLLGITWDFTPGKPFTLGKPRDFILRS